MATKVIKKGKHGALIRKTSRGGYTRFVKNTAKPGTVDVGIIDAKKRKDSPLTVATIAYINEFGMEHIPERPFFRWVTKEKKDEILKLSEQLYKKMQKDDMPIEQALGLLGQTIMDFVQRRIVDLQEPPNAPITIKRKGSSNPLIATSQMVNSVTYKVNK